MAKKATVKRKSAKKKAAKKAKKTAKTSKPVKKPIAKRKPVKRTTVKKRKKVIFKLDEAQAFVSSVKLPQVPSRIPSLKFGLDETPPVSLNEGIDQSIIVGSDIVSLGKDLPEEQRSLVVNSLLLAQLAATDFINKKKDLKAWYDKYFETLEKIGWLTQDFGFTKLKRSGQIFEVHKAIISVATTAFGAGATALKLVTTALAAIEKMGDGAPWMTIFKRSTESTKLARFQVTTAEPSADGGTMVSMMAFKLSTGSNITQVLFFKFKSANVDFQHSAGKVTLEKSLANALGPAIKEKVSNQLLNNIASISIE